MDQLTEHRLINAPVVYGFLYLVRAPAARANALTAALTEYCRRHELLLGAVFTECTAPAATAPDEPARSAAFTGLLDVLALPDTYGVVLPAASHLGPRPLAAARRIRLAEAGTRILLLRPPNRGRESADRGAAGHAIRRRSPT
jgi:hypothetical protein